MSLGTNCRLGRIVAFWNLGQIVAWDELSLFGTWDELSLGTNCRLGRIVAWDELSLGTNCRLGRIVALRVRYKEVIIKFKRCDIILVDIRTAVFVGRYMKEYRYL